MFGIFRRKETKNELLNRLLANLSKQGLFDHVVISDQTGLVVSSYSVPDIVSDITSKSIAALSSGVYDITIRSSKELLNDRLNFVILNSNFGEIFIVPIEIENYSKDFILTGLISKSSLRKIRENEQTIFDEVVNTINQYSLGLFNRKIKKSSSYKINSTIDRVNETAQTVKNIFT